MKKLLIVGLAVFTTGLIGSAQAESIAIDANSSASCLAQSSSSHNMGNTAGGTGGYGDSPTFYDSSRMTNLAENLKRVAQGDAIQITRSRTDLVARRVLNFTTEYTVVKSLDPNDPHLAIQVKPYGGNIVRTLTFNDWKQFVLNDRVVNFHLHCA